MFKSLEESVGDYTSEAFDGYDVKDVQGLLSDRLKKAKEHLNDTLESIKVLCEPVEPPKDSAAYSHYFCGDTSKKGELKENEQKRVTLYKQIVALIRAYANIANEMAEAGYTPKEIEEIKKD